MNSMNMSTMRIRAIIAIQIEPKVIEMSKSDSLTFQRLN